MERHDSSGTCRIVVAARIRENSCYAEVVMTKYLLWAVAVVPLLGLSGGAGQPPPAGAIKADEDKPCVVDLKALLAEKARRVNGLLLTIQAGQNIADHRDRIGVLWTLNYSGPRWPLIVLKPSLVLPTEGQTVLQFFATGKSGTTYAYEERSPDVYNGLPLRPRDWYVRLPDDQNEEESGVLGVELVTADLRRYFTRKLPQEFDRAKPPPLHVRLIHWAGDRGYGNRDAWTGRLWSDTVPVPLAYW
jgi:hypothetical protein